MAAWAVYSEHWRNVDQKLKYNSRAFSEISWHANDYKQPVRYKNNKTAIKHRVDNNVRVLLCPGLGKQPGRVNLVSRGRSLGRWTIHPGRRPRPCRSNSSHSPMWFKARWRRRLHRTFVLRRNSVVNVRLKSTADNVYEFVCPTNTTPLAVLRCITNRLAVFYVTCAGSPRV